MSRLPYLGTVLLLAVGLIFMWNGGVSNTTFSPDFTTDKFLRIKKGDSLEQVVALLGKPLYHWSEGRRIRYGYAYPIDKTKVSRIAEIDFLNGHVAKIYWGSSD